MVKHETYYVLIHKILLKTEEPEKQLKKRVYLLVKCTVSTMLGFEIY